MKTISKRFLKGGLAILLAVIMLFSSTITGFAAVVDNAETGANVDVSEVGAKTYVAGEYLYFKNSYVYGWDNTLWVVSGMYLWAHLWNSSTSTDIRMDLYTGTANSEGAIYRCKIPSAVTYNNVIFSRSTSSTSNNWAWGQSNDITLDASYNTYYNAYGNGNSGTPSKTRTASAPATCTTTVTNAISGSGTSSDPYLVYAGDSYTVQVKATKTDAGNEGFGYNINSSSSKAANNTTGTWTKSYTASTTANTTSTYTGYAWCYENSTSYYSSSYKASSTIYVKTVSKGYSYTAVANPTAGGTVTPKSGTATSVEITAEPADGYKFVNWTVTGEGSVDAPDSPTTTLTVNADDVVATANFEKLTYTVKFDVGDGSGTFADMTKTYGENLTLPTATPTAPNEDMAFLSWNTKADGTGDAYYAGGEYTANEGVTLYAQYKTTHVYYRFLDHDGTVLEDSTRIEVDTPVTAPADPTREHYTFTGWTPEKLTGINENTDFIATYSPVNYTITLNTDGGTVDGDNTINYNIESDDFTLPTPTKDYHDFLGWKDEDGKVSETVTITKGTTGNKTYTAQWQIWTYTISVAVSPDGGGEATVNDGNSATVEHGQEITLNAVPSEGYRFHSWQANGRDVAFTAEFVVAPEGDATYTATFKKIWDVTVVVPEGVTSVGYQGGNPSSTITYEDITEGWSSPFTATVLTGYELVGWEVKKVDADGIETVETFDTATVTVTVDANTTITPIVKKLYNVAVVSGATASDGTGYHAAGKEVTVKFVAPGGKYLESVSIALINGDIDIPNVTVNKDESSATFVMPESDLTLTPNYGDLLKVSFSPDVFSSTTLDADGYYPGQAVTIQVTPKGGHLINAITSEQTEVTYDKNNKEISFVMPATDVTLNVDYQASFHAYSDVITVHIDRDGPNNNTYDNTVEGGTVTMTCNGATLAEGGFADGDVTYTAEAKTGYDFVGFYSDSDCNKFLTAETTYTVSPESDITVYALFARIQYIKIEGYSYYPMTFDRTLKAYTYEYTDSNLGTAFSNAFNIRVTYTQNDQTVYSTFDGSLFSVTMNGNGYGRTISWGSAVWNVNAAQANTSLPLTIIVKPESIYTHNKIDVSARAVKNGATVFLSDGRYLNYDASTTILTDGVTGTDKVIGHNGDSEEYKVINLTEKKTLTWETTINHADAKYIYVDSYIVYKLESKTWEIVTPVSLGSNKYQGTYAVDGDCYIVPIFFYNDQYCTDKGYTHIELYFDASAIQNLSWGPFVAAYAWGTDNKEYFGAWPGQLLIPTPDGKSFYTQMTVPDTGSVNPAAGVTFNNYLFNTCPTNESGIFGLGASNVQTYDYREAITLYESDYEVITFVAKDSVDGYHGDYSDGSHTKNTISSSTTGVKTKYTFDYLYCRDGVTPMDFTGKPVTDTTAAKLVSEADYYVVSKGDVDYNKNDYSADLGYNGNWSVEWYIFDSNGTYKTKVLSTALWHDLDTTDDVNQTVLMTALGLTPETAAGKTVAISYDAPNNCPAGDYKDGKSHQIAYDGQWYGNMLDDTVKGQVIVGLDDGNGNFTLETDDTLNDGTYGEGYLKDLEGGLHQSLDIKIDYGIADLTASSKTGYRFIGWYTKKADGTYTQISNAPAYSTYINIDETYYAIFRAIGEAEVVINHRVYNNDDPAIPSHGGVGELSVKILDSDRNEITKSPVSTSSSTATFEATEGKTYIIQIYTTPLMNGEFFAWYTDSYKADGTKTYEEVLTEAEHVGSTTQVWNEFEYTYDSTDPDLLKVINIYSDIRRVSNYATLKYQYRNRFNVLRTYTVKNILLSDEECTGLDGEGNTFSGNDGKKYCPAYRTLLTFKTPSGEDYSFYCPQETVADRIKEYEAKDYTFESSYNKVVYYAPSAEVTEVYGQDVVWNVTDVNLTPATSEITLEADQTDCTYYLNYQIGTNTDTIPGKFNDLVQIEAPGELNGNKFSYWVEIKDGEEVILTYLQNYRYRLTETKSIKAVYEGVNDNLVWTPSINSVTYTREFADGGDYIYTDYLLAYNNNKALELNDVKVDENGKQKYQYGLLLVRDAGYYYEPTKKLEIEFPNAQDDEMIQNLESVAQGGSSAQFEIGSYKYNCYCYDLTSYALTNLNRCNYFRKYDNNKVVGGSHYYREYAFTAVAYLIDLSTGQIYLSDPEEVNFYAVATADTDSIA